MPYLEVLMGLEEAEEVAKKMCDRCKVMGHRCVNVCMRVRQKKVARCGQG